MVGGGASEPRLETQAVGKKLRSSRLFALRYISTPLRPVGAGDCVSGGPRESERRRERRIVLE